MPTTSTALGSPGWSPSNPSATIVTDPQSAALLADDGLAVTAWDDQGTAQIGDVTLSAHGREHAFNHARVPHVANVGVSVSAAGEPVLFHPGRCLRRGTGHGRRPRGADQRALDGRARHHRLRPQDRPALDRPDSRRAALTGGPGALPSACRDARRRRPDAFTTSPDTAAPEL
ncbi:MAG: hypothetical protein V9F04_02290 [Dermatophilaceae bacterium]